MKCPFCGYTESKVVDSRPADESSTIRRRRECLSCGKRFTTYETVESMPIVVIKRDGTREPFNREKLLNSMLRAIEKRSVTWDELEKATSNIEAIIQNTLDREVSSKDIGELAMAELRQIDEVAYVRFASVYRQFKDVDSFMKELQKLLGERK